MMPILIKSNVLTFLEDLPDEKTGFEKNFTLRHTSYVFSLLILYNFII